MSARRKGESIEAFRARDRQYKRAAYARQKGAADATHWPCPACGKMRVTEETLRVHRWLAHGFQEAAA